MKLKDHESYVFDIGDPHNYRERHQNPLFSTSPSEVMDNHVSAVVLDERPSNRKMDRSDVSGMSILSGVDTKFGYLSLFNPKLQINTRSAEVILNFTLQ